jgi:hypothetical protein
MAQNFYEQKPCFSYFDATTGTIDELGAYTVSSEEAYTEPEVFEQTGSVLLLKDYQYAYGNTMSDANDNPFEIDVLQQMEATTILTKSSAAMQNMILEKGTKDKIETNFDPFETQTFKTLADNVGYYSYYTRGQYTSYSSYEYKGKRLIVSFDAEAG